MREGVGNCFNIHFFFYSDVHDHSSDFRLPGLRLAARNRSRMWAATLSAANRLGAALVLNSPATSCRAVSEISRLYCCTFIYLDFHSSNHDFDEFGQRRLIMGRQPPPSYAQATGAPEPLVSSTSIPSRHRYTFFKH